MNGVNCVDCGKWREGKKFPLCTKCNQKRQAKEKFRTMRGKRPPPPPETTITVLEASREFQVSKSTILSWIRNPNHTIDADKTGYRYRVYKASIARYKKELEA